MEIGKRSRRRFRSIGVRAVQLASRDPDLQSVHRKTVPSFKQMNDEGAQWCRPAIGENEPFQGSYKLEIDQPVMTKHVRVVLSCVETPDATSFTVAEEQVRTCKKSDTAKTCKRKQMTGVMYTIGTKEASDFSDASRPDHPRNRGRWSPGHRAWCGGLADSYQQTNTVNRMVRMQLITQATSFNWNSIAESRESASGEASGNSLLGEAALHLAPDSSATGRRGGATAVAAMKSLLSSISSPQQLNCTAGVHLPTVIRYIPPPHHPRRHSHILSSASEPERDTWKTF